MVEEPPIGTVVDAEKGRSLITLVEAARYAGIHPVSMRRLVSKGVIRRRGRMGNSVLVSKDDVAAYVMGNAKLVYRAGLEVLITVHKRNGVLHPYRLKH